MRHSHMYIPNQVLIPIGVLLFRLARVMDLTAPLAPCLRRWMYYIINLGKAKGRVFLCCHW